MCPILAGDAGGYYMGTTFAPMGMDKDELVPGHLPPHQVQARRDWPDELMKITLAH